MRLEREKHRMEYIYKNNAAAQMNALTAQNEPYIFIIDYKAERCAVVPLGKLDSRETLFNFRGVRNDAGAVAKHAGKVTWQVKPPTLDEYAKRFDIVRRNLLAGNSYLVNLTCRMSVQTSLSLRDIYCRAAAPYKLWIADTLVCFSPETFVRIADGKISSFPMKGTIDAALPDAERLLLDNEKEAAEHATVVDLIRNDLSMVAEDVNVKRYRFVSRLSTNKGELLQTSSEITGRLPDDWREHAGDIIFRQLPAGSITGAPKPKTVKIIAEAEGYERGFYTGVMGCYANGRLDSAVMIRFIDTDGSALFCKTGGGITSKSDPIDEYNEIIAKAYVPIY